MQEKELPQEPLKIPAKKAQRLNASVKNMVWAILATLAVVIPVLALNARKDVSYQPNVDAASIAQQAQGSASFPLSHPNLGEGWSNNYARYNVGSDQVASWEVGYLTPKKQYIGLIESGNANETWVNQKIKDTTNTGTRDINGTTWKLYDSATPDTNGNTTKYLVTQKNNISYILNGTANLEEFDVLAKALTTGK